MVVALLLFVNVQLLLLNLRSDLFEEQPHYLRRQASPTQSDNEHVKGEMENENTVVVQLRTKTKKRRRRRRRRRRKRGEREDEQEKTADAMTSSDALPPDALPPEFEVVTSVRASHPAVLPSKMRSRLARALGSSRINGTSQVVARFTRVPSWLTSESEAEEPPLRDERNEAGQRTLTYRSASAHCLFSERTNSNVFLVSHRSKYWKQNLAASAQETAVELRALLSGKAHCPLPVRGQLGPSSGAGILAETQPPEVSFLVPMRNHVVRTIVKRIKAF